MTLRPIEELILHSRSKNVVIVSVFVSIILINKKVCKTIFFQFSWIASSYSLHKEEFE